MSVVGQGGRGEGINEAQLPLANNSWLRVMGEWGPYTMLSLYMCV